jgi:hypothetical protein
MTSGEWRWPNHFSRSAPCALVTQRLSDLGFKFRYDFRISLQDWDKTNAEN